MKNRHLSENEIQLYITEGSIISEDLLTHLESCSACQTEISVYKSIFTEVKKQERPAFEFDLSELVMEQIPTMKPKVSWAPYLAISLTIIFFSISFAAFSSYLLHVFRSLPLTLFIIIVTSSILILWFQSTEAIKIHQQKIKSINSN
jgi:hypothetical protein